MATKLLQLLFVAALIGAGTWLAGPVCGVTVGVLLGLPILEAPGRRRP